MRAETPQMDRSGQVSVKLMTLKCQKIKLPIKGDKARG